jgi:autotransporter translocation and assembly factor TamB
MKQMISRLYRLFFFLFSAALLLASLSFALMQTKWFMDKLQSKLVLEAKKQGITLHIDTISGIPPLKWTVRNAKLQWEDGTSIEAHKIKLRIAFFPLFKKQLSVSFLSVDKAYVSFSLFPDKTQKNVISSLIRTGLPVHLVARTLKVRELVLQNTSNNSSISVQVYAKAKVKKDFQEIFLDATISEIRQANSIHVLANGSVKKEFLEVSTSLSLANSDSLRPFFDLPFQTAVQAHIDVKGPWNSWKAFFSKTHSDRALFIETDVEIGHFSYPSFPFLDRKWKMETAFSILPDQTLSCEKFHLKSDWLQIAAKCTLSNTFYPENLFTTFSLSDLSVLNPYLPLPVHGGLQGKAGISKNTLKIEIASPSLQIGSQIYAPATFSAKALKQGEEWFGHSQLTLLNPALPWNAQCELRYLSPILEVNDISICTSDAKLDGNIFYDRHTENAEGNFFILASQLRPFRALFPNSDIDGSLGAEIYVCGSERIGHSMEKTSMKLSALLKNVRYQNNLIHSLHIDANLSDLFHHPSGAFSLEGDNLLIKDMLIAKLLFSSQENQNDQNDFTLEAKGRWKEDLEFSSSGQWCKNKNDWEIHLQTFSGSLLRKDFSLETPCHLGKINDRLFVNACNLQLAEGTLALFMDLYPSTVTLAAEAQHIPLDVISLFYPRFAFNGLLSLKGELQANKEDVKGGLSIALERAEVSDIGKQIPLQAKGTLQAHFSQKGVQVHSHLYATNNQFLDWTAFFPMSYSYNPFHLKIDPARPLSSELTMQGALEEIFDFINSGSHKATGLVTCHLFLSQTLETPALQGQIELQNGSYENYYTGTVLKDIQAIVNAFKNDLKLSSFQALDDKTGSLKATGSLSLSPKECFPFQIEAELNNMHLVRSETIDGYFNGPLYVKGNQFSALAQGTLTVPHAEIQIFDELPYEIPVLPVTFQNRPIHLQAPTLEIPKVYPLNLDIELSANNQVLVKGRGLNSEWGGNVRMTGTNMNVAASGTLSLIKGEFVFSGKTFNLTQGEISFSDKPTPSAYLKINGQLQMSNVTILAQMQGPLTAPTLSFYSVPYLPTSSILSLILFNKDISEITALQAIQLAQVIVSLSGKGGPDVLEAIRKSIGIDRLNIVGKDGTDEISVQIGWYLTHGVTVSLSQSTTSSDVTIEVDLKNGFIFQAETQNQEEGKFSLKWNKNY